MNNRAIELSEANVSDMVNGYLDAQLWAGLLYPDDENEEPQPYDDAGFTSDDIAVDYVNSVREELEAFVSAHPLAVRLYLNQRVLDAGQGSVSSYFGHDFYLTREHHGAGFWDRGLGHLGDYLTRLCQEYGEADSLFVDASGHLST